MTLEDFFTLTEMKDGISTLARVEELLSMMHEQEDCSMTNLGDTVRQWLTVARTLSATENISCLEHFVRLKGLHFFDQWLQEALRCSDDANDVDFVELVIAILVTLERVPVDHRKLSAFGIGSTISALCNHRTTDIKEKARILLEKWNEANNTKADFIFIDQSVASSNDKLEPLDGLNGVSECFRPHSDNLVGVVIKKPEVESYDPTVLRSPDSVEFDKASEAIAASLDPDPGAESCLNNNPSATHGYSVNHLRGLSDNSGGCSREVEADENGTCSSKSSQDGRFHTGGSSVADMIIPSEKHVTMLKLPSNLDSKKNASGETVPCKPNSLSSKATEDIDSGQPTGMELDCEIDALELARQVAIEVEHEVVDYREPFCSSTDADSGDITDAGGSDVEGKQDEHDAIDSGDCVDGVGHNSEADKLEQQEVNSDESAASDLPLDDAQKGPSQPTTLKFVERESLTKEITGDASSTMAGSSKVTRIVADMDGCEQDSESRKPSSNNINSDSQVDRSVCCFDLNAACTEDPECLADPVLNAVTSLSAPIAVVAPSKGAPTLPIPPLHFEGGLGWRGSAATSAFRPASPRRTPDLEMVQSCSRIHKASSIEIDLNVADGGDVAAIDPVAVDLVSASIVPPSGELSVEVNSTRAERFAWDLNCVGDEDSAMALPLPFWRLQQNGDQGASSASSSSTRQPLMRDFDLNDNLDASSSRGNLKKQSFGASTASGSSRIDDKAPSITLLGSRLPVEMKDFVFYSAPPSFPANGFSMEHPVVAGMQLPYAHMPPSPHSYGFRALQKMVPIPPPGLFGHGSISYTGSATEWNGGMPGRPPFLMTLNGASTSQPGLDLNSSSTNTWEHAMMAAAAQPVSPAEMPLKRKEPECGWDPYGSCYKQVTSWR